MREGALLSVGLVVDFKLWGLHSGRMHEIYRHWDSAKVGLVNGLLNDAGIPTILKNWNATNITTIPIPEFYPVIFVETREAVELGTALIEEFFSEQGEGLEDWVCEKCGETVEGSLAECWSCQAEKGDPPSPSFEERDG